MLGVSLIIKYLMMDVNISTSLILIVFTVLISGVQLLIFGIIGQYLGKVYLETKQRPLYIVKEEKILDNKEIEVDEEVKVLKRIIFIYSHLLFLSC